MDYISILNDWKLDFKNEHYLKRLVKFLNYKKANPSSGKIHRHHIIPKSWAKEYAGDVDNLVYLTPREHLFAHYLMTKAFPHNYQMAYAFQRLCHGGNCTKENVKPSHLLALEKQREHKVYSHPPEIIAKATATRIANGSNKSAIKGKRCYNNGKADKYFFEGEEEEGFVLGSLKKGISKNAHWSELSKLTVSLKMQNEMIVRFESGWNNRATIKGENNAFYGSKNAHDPITLKNYRILRGEEIPDSLVEGYYYDPEEWAKRSEKISNALKGKPHWWQDKINKNPIKIAKMAEKHRGMKRTEEGKSNMRKAKERFYANGGKNPIKGKKCAYDISTLELHFFGPNEPLPEGYAWGNSKVKKFWYESPTGEKVKFNQKNAPEGWVRCQAE